MSVFKQSEQSDVKQAVFLTFWLSAIPTKSLTNINFFAMKYYLFDYYVDKTVNKYPQCVPSYRQPGNYDINSESSRTKLLHTEFPKVKPDLIFFLEKNANLTSLVAPDNMGTAQGLLMNRELYEVFNKYKLYNSKFYDASVVYEAKEYEYFWLHVVLDYDDPNVDFNRTTYVKQTSFTTPGIQANADVPELRYSNMSDKSKDYERTGHVRINKLSLVDDFVRKEYDFFRFLACSTDIKYFVSEPLLKEVAKLKPTGCRFAKQNILHEYSY